ncbi:MAG: S1C family serine protease [Candidatus Limnocylindrales bacterium]
MSFIDDLQGAVQGAAQQVGPSIVGIGRHRRGSGVVIGAGQVLTNAHNLRGDEVTVTFGDGRSAVGTVRGIDRDGDLAVIGVDTGDAPAIGWATETNLAVGSVVFGAAASRSSGSRVTLGTVSAIGRAFRGPGGRRISGSIEHTAPLASGSSGGALLDGAGHFVGLNTNRIGEGFYLALPADASLRERVESLAGGSSVERPRLGVAIAPGFVARRLRRSVGLPDRAGLLVREVEDDSSAAAAGIARGDLIVSVAGTAVTDADELLDAIGAAREPFEITLVRGADELTVTVGAAAQRAN